MLPDAWPTWLVVITGLGLVSTAMLAIVTLLRQAGHGVSIAARWVRGVVVDAITDVVRDHTLSPQQVAEVVEAKVAPIMAEVRPNGGSSLKDQVTALQQDLTETGQVLRDHVQHSSLDRADLRRWLEHVDPGRHADPGRPPADPDDGPAY